LLFIFTFSSLVIRVHLPPFLLNDKKFFFYNENFYASHYVKSFFVSFLLYVFLVFSCCLYLPFLLLLFTSTFHLFSSCCYSRPLYTFSPLVVLNDKKFFFYNESFYTSHYVKKFFKTLFSQLKKNTNFFNTKIYVNGYFCIFRFWFWFRLQL
jgi:hypothetical protein